MKSRVFRCGALALALLLPLAAGCSTEELKAADIYTKSLEASADMQSLSGDLKVNMKLAQGEEKMDVTTGVSMEAVMKPELALHMKMNVNMLGMDNAMEMYGTKDALYMQQSPGSDWTKVPFDASIGMPDYKSQFDPAKQLERMKPYIKDFTLQEEKDAYVIHMTGTGDDLKSFILDEMKNNAPGGAGQEAAEAMSNMKIDLVDITYSIDKKTYLPHSMDMKAIFQIEAEGIAAHMDMDSSMVYKDFNQLKEIPVPPGVLKAD